MCAACTDRAAVRMPCRARKIPARLVNVPPEPISWAPRQSRRGTLRANVVAHCAAQLAHAARRDAVLEVLLGQPNRAERQRHETLDDAFGAERELERSRRRCPSRRCGRRPCRSGRRALRKLSRASSSPSSTRTRSPVTRCTSVRNAAALLASRTALVATTSMRSAPSCLARASPCARRLRSPRESRCRRAAPFAASPVASRGAAFISSTT